MESKQANPGPLCSPEDSQRTLYGFSLTHRFFSWLISLYICACIGLGYLGFGDFAFVFDILIVWFKFLIFNDFLKVPICDRYICSGSQIQRWNFDGCWYGRLDSNPMILYHKISYLFLCSVLVHYLTWLVVDLLEIEHWC